MGGRTAGRSRQFRYRENQRNRSGMYHIYCNRELLCQLRENLKFFKRVAKDARGLRRAAVAVTIVDFRNQGNLDGLGHHHSDTGSIILTRRSAKLRNHAGQWALPGGSVDDGERPEETALRELKEEVGLEVQQSDVIGCLDDFVTRSGFLITPVIVWGGLVKTLVADDNEVASIHRIPCVEFLRSHSPVLEEGSEAGRPVLYLSVGQSWIASPTAAIIHQFSQTAILGKECRVSHYDQPFFAWS